MSLLTKAIFLLALYLGALVAISFQSASASPTMTLMVVTGSLADGSSASGSVDSEADSCSGDFSEKMVTQPEEVRLLQQPGDDNSHNHHPSDHHSLYNDGVDFQHSMKSWKKWTPPENLFQKSSTIVFPSNSNNGKNGTPANQKSHKVRFNCSHYSSSCHDCNRHGCNFMACGRHTVCINGQTYISWKSANRCNRIDKCSAHPKRNSQQISSSSVSTYYLPASSNNGGVPNHENGVGGTKISKNRSNLHSRASNRFRQTSTSSSSSTPSSHNVKQSNNRHGELYGVNYFSRSGGENDNAHKITNSASGHEIRPSRSRYSKLNIGSQSLMSGRYVNQPASSSSDSGVYYSGSSSHRFGIEEGGKSKGGNKELRIPSISIGTVIALMICSSMVVSAVIIVAVKKIHKIYNHNKSMSYGTLEEEH